MLHFDAHPDLACPNVPARCCFQPRNDSDGMDLYECLDATSSGIAEWILPLVLAGNLTTLQWVKPAHSQQLPQGQHEYQVGVSIPPLSVETTRLVTSFLDLPSSARVRVDWKHPYYLDDASVVSTDELLFAKRLHLTVSELDGEENEKCIESGPQKELELVETESCCHGDWALDICLDYFACLNPFLTDIEAIDPMFAKNLVHVVTRTRLQTATNGDAVLEPTCYECELAGFHATLRRVLQEKGGSDSIHQLARFYTSELEGRILAEKLLQSLSANQESSTLTTMAMEAVSNLSMPHDPKISLKALQESVAQGLDSVSPLLRRVKTNSGDPFVVTIARSSNDGFTPLAIVEDLQNHILTMVHETFCNCGCNEFLSELAGSEGTADRECRLRLIFDYGESEGSSFD
jgi:hypothetical protein